MKKKLLTTVVGATLAVVGQAAFAVEAKISGQLNRAIMVADDGVINEVHHVDGQPSGSRFRFTGTEDMLPGVKAGIYWEIGFQSQGSNTVTQTSRNGTAAAAVERHQYVFFQGSFGKFSFGQTEGAGKGAPGMDLSGTDLISNGAPDFGDAMVFRVDTSTPTGTAGPTLGSVINQQDFESRYDLARYDSPSLGGVVITGTRGQKSDKNVSELAVRYTSDFGAAGKIAAAVARSERSTVVLGEKDTITGGSVSYLLPFGLNFTYGMTDRENISSTTAVATDREGKWKWFKVGFRTGNHAVSVDTMTGDDQAQLNDEASMLGLGYVYTPTKTIELYAGARKWSLDRPGTNFEDIDIYVAGTRIKF